MRSQTAANRDPRRRLRYDEGTGPNLLPNVGVFARAGPSGAPKPKKSAKPKKKNGDAEPSESRSPSPSLLEPSTNLEGEDVGDDGSAADGDASDDGPLLEPSTNSEGEDVGEDGSAAGNELEQSNEVQSSSPESKKPKICLYVKFKKAANSGEAPGKF